MPLSNSLWGESQSRRYWRHGTPVQPGPGQVAPPQRSPLDSQHASESVLAEKNRNIVHLFSQHLDRQHHRCTILLTRSMLQSLHRQRKKKNTLYTCSAQSQRGSTTTALTVCFRVCIDRERKKRHCTPVQPSLREVAPLPHSQYASKTVSTEKEKKDTVHLFSQISER